MKTKSSIRKPLTLKPLSMLFTVTLLSASLLVSACSNNETAETVGANDTAAVAETENNVGANSVTEENPTDQTAAVDADDLSESDISENDISESDSAKNETTIDSDNINPMTTAAKQPSLVTSPTEANTPEDTVKQALDSLYYGDVKQAVKYYKVDMANFEEELANTQSAFQQTVEGVTITNTKYNSDKTRATITGELMLKNQKEPAPLTYELQKIEGQWKILG